MMEAKLDCLLIRQDQDDTGLIVRAFRAESEARFSVEGRAGYLIGREAYAQTSAQERAAIWDRLTTLAISDFEKKAQFQRTVMLEVFPDEPALSKMGYTVVFVLALIVLAFIAACAKLAITGEI